MYISFFNFQLSIRETFIWRWADRAISSATK